MNKASWSYADVPRLDGKTIVVTGANSGIGWEAARAFARAGAQVVLACRNRDKTMAAMDRLVADQPAARLEFMVLDLADLSSVRAFAQEFCRKHDRLDVLVNNAGIMAIPRRETADGFEMQLGVNHLGHFALTGLLWEHIASSAPSRVVSISSGAHRGGRIDFDDLQGTRRYRKWFAYGHSKLANLLFTFELNRRSNARGLDVKAVAAHPGYARTNLVFVGPQMESSSFAMRLWTVGNELLSQTAEAGAMPTVYAAVAEDVEGGDFIGPGGLARMRGAPVKEKARSTAYDPKTARRLWEVSEQLTGVRFASLTG